MIYTVLRDNNNQLWLQLEPRSAEEVQQVTLLNAKYGRVTYSGGPYWIPLSERPGGTPAAIVTELQPLPTEEVAPPEADSPTDNPAPGPAPGLARDPDGPPAPVIP